MNTNIMVKLENYDQYMRIRTYDRQNGTKWGFLVDKNRLSAHINNGFPHCYMERDGLNVISIWQENDSYHVRIDWITSGSGAEFHGYSQIFNIPKNSIRLLLLGYISSDKVLCKLERKRTPIINHANRTIREIQENKLMKRAFCKAMRDCFQYDGETVHLYNDGNSFYFEDFCGEKQVMNGGLILHSFEQIGRNHTRYPAYRYRVHT